MKSSHEPTSDLEWFEQQLASEPRQLAAFRSFWLRLNGPHGDNDELLMLVRFHILLHRQMCEIPLSIAEERKRTNQDLEVFHRRLLADLDAPLRQLRDLANAIATKVTTNTQLTERMASSVRGDIGQATRTIAEASAAFRQHASERTVEKIAQQIADRAELRCASLHSGLLNDAKMFLTDLKQQRLKFYDLVENLQELREQWTRPTLVRERIAYFLFGGLAMLAGIGALFTLCS